MVKPVLIKPMRFLSFLRLLNSTSIIFTVQIRLKFHDMFVTSGCFRVLKTAMHLSTRPSYPHLLKSSAASRVLNANNGNLESFGLVVIPFL